VAIPAQNRDPAALSGDEIDAHAMTYVEQAQHILLPGEDRLEVRRNSNGSRRGHGDVLRLTSRVTVAVCSSGTTSRRATKR